MDSASAAGFCQAVEDSRAYLGWRSEARPRLLCLPLGLGKLFLGLTCQFFEGRSSIRALSDRVPWKKLLAGLLLAAGRHGVPRSRMTVLRNAHAPSG